MGKALLRTMYQAALVLLVLVSATLSIGFGAASTDDDTVVAGSLAEMLQDARAVISDDQDLINNSEVGDKHLTGQVVLDEALALYAKNTGVDPTKIDPATRQGRLLQAMMRAIVEVTNDNQPTINAKGIGFKAFIPAAFARLVNERFAELAKGEAVIKVTAPPELVRNRKARPDAWEAEIIKTKLLDPAWPRGKPYSATVDAGGRPVYRVMVPEYYTASCLACHGSPKGEMDITGYPKEGGKADDLGAVISIALYH